MKPPIHCGTCHQRIPTVRPASARLFDAIERCGWWIGLGILCLAVLLNVGA